MDFILKNVAVRNIMKNILSQTVIAILFTGISFAERSNAQAVLNRIVSISMDDTRLSSALKQVERDANIKFIYSRNVVNIDQKVSIQATDQKLGLVLDKLLNSKGILYEVFDNRIVLSNKRDKAFNNIPVEGLKDLIIDEKGVLGVTGKVTDQKGEPLIGVSVKVRGTNLGTSTDVNGNYSLNISDGNAGLIFTYIGYVTQEISVNNQTEINVSLVEDAKSLDEVILVGYGTQKKVNLTGSVAYVNAEKLEKRNVTKSSLLLQGQLSGISVRQQSGNPTSNNATLTIRGQGTFSSAGSSPLVLVDNIESVLDNVDPNDIESISILKDAASASIYGSKAANGVILIQTKKGMAGKTVFSYNYYTGNQAPTMIPEMVDSWEYAMAFNEAMVNGGQAPRYTADEIQKFKSGTDPNYPNFNHLDYLWDSGRGIENKHDLSIRGGTAGTQYMFSAGYFDQQGLVMKNSGDRYSMRLNLDTRLKDNLKLGVKLAGNKDTGKEPSSAFGGGLGNIVRGALRLPNTLPGPSSDGYFSRSETIHPEADLNSKSFDKNNRAYFYSNVDMVWDILKDLKITGQVGYTYGTLESKSYRASYDVTPTFRYTNNSLNVNMANNSALTLQSIIEYNKKIKKHTFHLLGGASGQSYVSKFLDAYRDQFPNNEIYEISAGAVARGTQGGSSTMNTLRSYFGRLNYDFNDKYLFEANFRYDGSSRFSADKRWGLFPSLSGAWRVSQENFFKDTLPWFSNFKLRFSWGVLGNESIGDYPYQDLISLGQNYPFGNQLSAGAAVTTIANKNITWETTKVTDVGLDMSLFNNKLSLTADYYIRTTNDILYGVSTSRLLGALPSTTNAGTVENKGWDFDLSYRNTIGAFSFSSTAILSFVDNKVLKLANLERDINRGLFVGYPIGSTYGFVSDGLFGSKAEVDKAPVQPFPFLREAGEIRYVDISGPKGIPDGVVNSTYDRMILGKPIPTSTYGLSLNGAYKNFDFNLLLQGEGGRNDMVALEHFFAIDNLSNVQKFMWEGRWTPENPNAIYPKIRLTPVDFYTQNRVDFFYRDATFLRLKNMQIGYSLPKKLLDKISLDKLRLYVTGENLFTLTNYYKGWDPEMRTGGGTRWYPLSKLYVAGVKIDF